MLLGVGSFSLAAYLLLDASLHIICGLDFGIFLSLEQSHELFRSFILVTVAIGGRRLGRLDLGPFRRLSARSSHRIDHFGWDGGRIGRLYAGYGRTATRSVADCRRGLEVRGRVTISLCLADIHDWSGRQ